MPDLIDSVYFLAVIISALFSDHVAPEDFTCGSCHKRTFSHL